MGLYLPNNGHLAFIPPIELSIWSIHIFQKRQLFYGLNGSLCTGSMQGTVYKAQARSLFFAGFLCTFWPNHLFQTLPSRIEALQWFGSCDQVFMLLLFVTYIVFRFWKTGSFGPYICNRCGFTVIMGFNIGSPSSVTCGSICFLVLKTGFSRYMPSCTWCLEKSVCKVKSESFSLFDYISINLVFENHWIIILKATRVQKLPTRPWWNKNRNAKVEGGRIQALLGLYLSRL